MKKILYIFTILLFAFSSCDRHEPHFGLNDELVITEEDKGKDPNIGVVVGFDTEQVTSTDFTNLNLFFFDESDKLIRHSYHTDMEQIGLTKMLVESGAYAIFAVFNTEEDFLQEIETKARTRSDLPALYLSSLIESVNDYYAADTYPDMLTGMVRHNVENSVEQVIIPITNEPITNEITTLTLVLNCPSDELPPFVSSQKARTRAASTHTLRAVVEAYQKGTKNRVMRKTALIGDNGEIELVLTSGEYDLRVWSDFIHTDADPSTDLYYNTANTANISIQSKEDYTGNNKYKDAFAQTHSITIDGTQTEQSASIALYRPFARYRIVATDVADYLKKRDITPLEDLQIEIVYETFFPTAYDMTAAILSGSDTGYKFASTATETTAEETTLATDYVLVNGKESSVQVGIYIRDAEGELVSSVKGITIEYRANHLTTITGDFLTAGKGGISIDTDWDDDINVEF